MVARTRNQISAVAEIRQVILVVFDFFFGNICSWPCEQNDHDYIYNLEIYLFLLITMYHRFVLKCR